MSKVEKAFAIENARISFVSLVDKAANLRKFLITKAEDGKATFATCGRIIKADTGSHYATGIVYEPMVEDAQGNFMTEAEITKAAHWFAKNSNKVDLQHSFEPLDGACVVESWIAKSDTTIGDAAVKKGTWLMTVEVTDDNIWKSIEKGKITGFSMGGIGDISKEDTSLSDEKATVKKNLFAKFGELFGKSSSVEKGELANKINDDVLREKRREQYWTVQSGLQGIIFNTEKEPTTEEIKSALSDFSDIVLGIFSDTSKGEQVEKSGRKFSSKNKSKLQEVYNTLGELLSEAESAQNAEGDINSQQGAKASENANSERNTEGVQNVNKSDMESAIISAVKKALGTPEQPAEPANNRAAFEPTEENIAKMVNAAVEKALNENVQKSEKQTVTADDVQKMIEKAVSEKVEPILKQRGLPTNIGSGEELSKSEEQPHYMHGIL